MKRQVTIGLDGYIRYRRQFTRKTGQGDPVIQYGKWKTITFQHNPDINKRGAIRKIIDKLIEVVNNG